VGARNKSIKVWEPQYTHIPLNLLRMVLRQYLYPKTTEHNRNDETKNVDEHQKKSHASQEEI
jgi:hypothetical protein